MSSETRRDPSEPRHRALDARERIPVAVLGATGVVGQRLVALLDAHPWFRLDALTASERSAGLPYGEAVRWVQAGAIPEGAAARTVRPTEPPLDGVPLVFSALDSSVAGPLEEAFAGAGHLVVSNARNHRMEPRVPLLVPEVNPAHLRLLGRGDGNGGIVTNPNCSTIGLALALAPLDREFGLKGVQVTTLQAVSGAGLPGISALEALDNVVPHIPGEEEKMERESLKILGSLDRSEPPSRVVPRDLTIGAQCTRVPVVDGHTQCVSVELEDEPSPEEAAAVLGRFRARPQALGLPTAPRFPVHVLDDPAHPQPRLHRALEGGMAVGVGRLRRCPVLHLRFVTVSHNVVRGAAGGALLCGELAVAEGLLGAARTPDAVAAPD